ncbi:hypothetical protein M1328_02605 [Patescibacteria group bacterium]|nr:hypothetical protein [Patescibacteria group bacterium]
MLKILKGLFLFSVFAILLSVSSRVYAADFKADYQVQYNLFQTKDNLTSNVKFNIKITNLRGDVYVNKFAISFPRSFAISNLKSSDDHGEVIPKVTTDDQNIKVEMEFSNPNIGRDTVNNFYLTFDQSNLFKTNGNVWEVAIPVIENRQDGDYQVTVNLPSDTNKKISIAKPKPTTISGNQIIWDNPQTKTIYAVFGDTQIYDAELTYHLKNSDVFPIITEVAFPPDSLYQKIFLKSIDPPPNSVYQDSDGNYMGKYYLNPLESKTIVFDALIEVFAEPRDEMIPIIRSMMDTQKNYLLDQQKYWTITSLDKISSLQTPLDIYNFDVNDLHYNYKKVNSDNTRLGAQTVLDHPDQAVCLEFTDLFVAAAREKGIMSREVEGFGFSYDPQLQPLSLVSDILHAWPEYYNQDANYWVPVDPTWQNTSGIDYFSSFDLNHIAFVFHGKKPDYPLPAGMYKTGDSKDISIKATTEVPLDKKEVGIEGFGLPANIFDNKDYEGKFFIKNNGNVYLLDVPIEIRGGNISVTGDKTTIASLAPFEKREIDFQYRSSLKNQPAQGKISIYVYGSKLVESSVKIVPHIFETILFVCFGFLVVFGIIVVYKKVRS